MHAIFVIEEEQPAQGFFIYIKPQNGVFGFVAQNWAREVCKTFGHFFNCYPPPCLLRFLKEDGINLG